MNERTLKKLLITLNQHLPKERITLSEALKEKRPSYEGKDGRTYILSRDELERMAQILPESRWPFLKIPLIIRGNPMEESPGWIVVGGDECTLVANCLGKALKNGEKTNEMKIYHAHLLELRRIFSTTTVIMSSI